MDESPTDSKGKARKISIKVTEPAPPIQEPIEPVQQAIEPDRKKIRNAYIFIGIGVALVVASSVDIYSPDAKGQASMGLLIVGGLWLVYGIFSYLRAKG